MGVLKEKFISDFQLRASGGKGWYIATNKAKALCCPKCKHNDQTRLAFIFSDNVSSFKCVKCGYSSRLEKFLWLSKKLEYISKFRQISSEDIIKKKQLLREEKLNIDLSELPEVILPLFFKRVKYSSYLHKRGASIDIYKHWIIGKTDFENLKNYIIFVIPDENGRNVGWVARSFLSKEEIDYHNKNSDFKILRWRNSKSDFGKIVFGLNEISEETEEIIVVEGITSKLRTDCELKLYNQNKIKCCCTFGKKITDTQLQKIRNIGKNVDKIILFYDSDAIDESKKTSYKFKSQFAEVFLAFCNFKDENGHYKDAGDLNKEEFEEIFSKLQTPFEFFNKRLNKKKLL